MTVDGFDIFAFIVFAVLLAAVVFMIVELGSLPGRIAVKRASLSRRGRCGGLDQPGHARRRGRLR